MMTLPPALRKLDALLDPAGVIGIGLAVFATAAYFSAVQPAREQLAQLQTKAARQKSSGPQEGVRAAAMRGAEQLEQFNRSFPAPADTPALMLKLHEIAAQNSIALDTGEYRLTRDREGGLSRYQVTLPLRGTYWQVRLFLAQVLDEMPASALEEISIKRDSVGARGVETRVRIAFYLGANP